jgi:hypothetical protein
LEEQPSQVSSDQDELPQPESKRKRTKKPDRGNYRKVLTGLTLNLVAAAMLSATFGLGLIAVLASAQAIYAAMDPQNRQFKPPPEPSTDMPVASILLVVLLIISEGIDLAGLGYCLGAPQKDGARPLAWASLIAAATGFPFACVGGLLKLGASTDAVGGAFLILGILLVCSSKVLYLIFVRALGLAMEVLRLARHVYLIFFLVLLAGLFHLIVLSVSGFELNGEIFGVVSGRGTGAGLQDVSVTVLFTWFASGLILLYALIHFAVTIYDGRGEVFYHLSGRQKTQRIGI